jgi:hypothetical protein
MEIYTYCVDLPDGIHEAVTPCADGYTIYINRALTYEHQLEAYAHALHHIHEEDFLKSDVQSIESDAHRWSA